MSSERRIQSSRINGAKSTGPKTPRGKAHSSKNATTHGLFSKTIIVEGESADRFAALLARIALSYERREEMQPQTSIEDSLVENMAICRWRQRRLLSMETAGLTHEIRQQGLTAAADQAPMMNLDAPTRAVLAFTALTTRSRAVDLLSRYETRYDRQFCRSFDRLLALRAKKVIS